MTPSIPFDETSRELLKDPIVAAMYLEEILTLEDWELFKVALKHVVEAILGDTTALSE